MRWKLPPTEPACLRPEDFHRIEFRWEFIFASFKRKYIFYRISSPQVKPIIHKNLQMHIKPTSQAINKLCAGLLLLLANVRKWLYRGTFDGIKSHCVSRSSHNCVWHEKMAIGSSADLWVHLMKTCTIYVSNEACLGRYAIIFMIVLFSFNTHCNSRFPQWWFSLNYHYILMKVQDGVQGMARTWFWTRLFYVLW